MEPHESLKKLKSKHSGEEEATRPKRFRIVKLEDRIAPVKASGNTKKCISLQTCWLCATLGCW